MSADEGETATEALIRERVVATWAFRTRAEIEASARFKRMAEELAHVGAEPVVVQGALDAAADEARHRDLCAELAAKWGNPDAKNHHPPPTRIGRSSMEPRDRLLWEVVAVCCIAESMNTALLTRCFEVAKDESIRSTLHELLKDEVRHSRLGWAHLAAERAQGRGDFLPDVLPLMLAGSVDPGFLDGSKVLPWSDELYDYGELPSFELVRIYRDMLESVIFPGFESFGLDTSKSRTWLAEHLRAG